MDTLAVPRALPEGATADRRAGGGRSAALARDVGGGFGDSALLIPLAIALITVNHLNATAVFAGAGVLYVATGVWHRLPIPVQPLKAVSAIAIGVGLGASGIAAAGLLIGALFLALSLTGIADRLRPVFTPAVVRGIQLAVGILLVRTAWELMTRHHQFVFSLAGGLEGPLLGVAIALLVAAAAWRRLPGIPLLVLGGGLLLGVVAGHHRVSGLALGPQPLSLALPSGAVFLTALWTLAVPQLALSLGNSLMATSSASVSYFGDRGRRVTPGRLALSMGLANLVVSPLGGMPMCHGAGGLTAHVRMGARSGVATATYGVVLITLAVVVGAGAPTVLAFLPAAVLAGLLLYVGVMHATLIGELRSHVDVAVALVIGAVSAITGNITIGVGVGLVCVAALALRSRVSHWATATASPVHAEPPVHAVESPRP
ncbi:MAG: putative sulfate/molybdate transporter [Candidatus Dormibacteraeota bacterium]|uniref:Sulfate/molybdate transporter n=1 Tax=Candidatus Aeolococcus gillhamiae TaxID=3127015 RepID=A0A934JVU8_9BACT|nr:putative sulfate/molybdate transporter [Candidatus Dormibacteraeota bacterium]